MSEKKSISNLKTQGLIHSGRQIGNVQRENRKDIRVWVTCETISEAQDPRAMQLKFLI